MTKKELKLLITECVTELKLKSMLKSVIKESLKSVKIKNEDSLKAKMDELTYAIKSIDENIIVEPAGANQYQICNCDPHHFSIYSMTDDNFTVTHFKNKTDRTKKFNLTFEDLKKFVVETLKEKKADFGQEKWEKCVKNSEDKEGKKNLDKPQETDEKVTDDVTKKDDLPDAPMKTVEKIKKQVDHDIKGKKAEYKYPKQKDKKLTVKPTVFKGRGKQKSN